MPRRVKMEGLEGRVALITGASRGLGAHMCEFLAARGVNIIAVDICRNIPGIYPMGTLSELDRVVLRCREFGVLASAEVADVRSLTAVVSLVDRVVRAFGRIDILVNNAGICADGTIVDIPIETVDLILDVNLAGAFRLTQAVSRVMQEQGSGKIVNIASSAGGLRALAGGSAYAASKAALIMATKCWAHDLAPFHINVNAVAPGVVMTGMIAGLATANCASADIAAEFENYRSGSLFTGANGVVRDVDVSAAVAFLVSNHAARVTGEVLAVDAGLVAR